MGVASESSTVRSLNMKFHEFGDRNLPPILLIHGGGSSWWNYLRQARILSEEYRVILPTLNGHGEEYQFDYISTEDSALEILDYVKANLDFKNQEKISHLLFSLPQALVEVIHHYSEEDLKRYDKVIKLEK